MHHEPNLDQAVRALREAAGPETLSPATRSAILRRIREQKPAGHPLAMLFPTSWRLVLAGALPVALALTVVFLAGRAQDSNVSISADPVVHKVGGKVVFEVAAGATVTKSTVPFRFDERAAVQVRDGRYADGIGNGPRLVFYKIEQ